MADAKREWRKALDEHAARTMADVIVWGAANAGYNCIQPGPTMGGRATIDIMGPDGAWRRFYVRLTEVAV